MIETGKDAEGFLRYPAGIVGRPIHIHHIRAGQCITFKPLELC